jgi:hypothetical protein
VPDGGVTQSWDGTWFNSVTSSACGATTQCFQQQCAAPGRYTAHMCLYKSQGDGGTLETCAAAQTRTCTDVAFDWPTMGTVSGVVGP